VLRVHRVVDGDREAVITGYEVVPQRSVGAPIFRRYAELNAILGRLRDLDVAKLIDELFPEGDHDVELLREAALAVSEKAESASDVLGELLRVITQPEVPQALTSFV